jgi:hypothetical protein
VLYKALVLLAIACVHKLSTDCLNSTLRCKQSDLSMAVLELYQIVVAALLWGSEWKRKKILFYCDNEATVAIVKKGRSKCIEIIKLMRQLACVHKLSTDCFNSTLRCKQSDTCVETALHVGRDCGICPSVDERISPT